MLIKPEWCFGTLIIKTDHGAYAFCSDVWPTRLAVRDMLRALCGEPDQDGFYVCHEDHQWLEEHLRSVSRLGSYHIGLLAIRDTAELGGDGELAASISAAGTLAVAIFEKSFGAKRADAQAMVRMNIIGQQRMSQAESHE